jgi:hypothetical protein
LVLLTGAFFFAGAFLIGDLLEFAGAVELIIGLTSFLASVDLICANQLSSTIVSNLAGV